MFDLRGATRTLRFMGIVALFSAIACGTVQHAGEGLAAPVHPTILRLEQVLEEDPENGAALYILARFYAGSEPDTALGVLEKLRDIGWNYALDDSDFEPLLALERYRTISAELAAREPRIGDSEVAFELGLEETRSEGMEWDEKTNQFYLGSAELRKVIVTDSTGVVITHLPIGDELLLAPLGMQIDPRRRVLWVASAAAPFMAGYEAEMEGRSMLTGISLDDGTAISRFETGSSEQPSLLNDLALLGGSRVAVTDSQRGIVWIAHPERGTFESLTVAGALWAPNGIARSPDGENLIVATFPGLFRIGLEDGSVSPIVTRAGVRLNGIDGLERDGDTLIGIQNLVGRVRIWRLDPSLSLDRVDATILESGDHRLENPTTGAVAGDYFYYMANPGTGTGRIRMMRIRLRESGSSASEDPSDVWVTEIGIPQ